MQVIQQQLFPEIASEYPGTVYYAAGPDGSIKIGYTTRPITARLRELGSSLIYTCPGGPLDEKRHLRRWQEYRIGTSEWHWPADELLLWLVSLIIAERNVLGAKTLQMLIEARWAKREVA